MASNRNCDLGHMNIFKKIGKILGDEEVFKCQECFSQKRASCRRLPKMLILCRMLSAVHTMCVCVYAISSVQFSRSVVSDSL